MSMTPQDALARAIEHREIFHDEMLDLMRQIMSGKTSPVMIAAITIALRVKKETIGEITAAAQVMRELATKVEVKDAHNLVAVVPPPAGGGPDPAPRGGGRPPHPRAAVGGPGGGGARPSTTAPAPFFAAAAAG